MRQLKRILVFPILFLYEFRKNKYSGNRYAHSLCSMSEMPGKCIVRSSSLRGAFGKDGAQDMIAEELLKNALSYDHTDSNVGGMGNKCVTIDIEDYYRTYGPMVLRRCRSILRDEDAAFDAMQEVFVKLMKNAGRLKGDFPSSLLYRMATNTCLNIIRGTRSISVSPDDMIIAGIARYDDSQDRFVLGDFIDFIFQKEHSSPREMAVMHWWNSAPTGSGHCFFWHGPHRTSARMIRSRS